jgi:glycosyltransferase involved in cell wall biosynthesis
MKVSVIVPCFNEHQTIAQIVAAVRAAPIKGIEPVVVDDASTDTAETLRGKISYEIDRVIFHEVNRGKGAALRSGLAVATGNMVLVQDAELEYNPDDYRALLEPIFSGKADAVFGSRVMGGRPHRVVYFWHMVGNKFLTLLSNMCTNLNLTDLETCYKAFRTSVIRDLLICQTGSASSQRLQPSWRRRAAASTRWAFPMMGELTKKERRFPGKMVSAPSTRF